MAGRFTERIDVRVSAPVAEGIKRWADRTGMDENDVVRTLIEHGVNNPPQTMVELAEARRAIWEQGESMAVAS